MKKILIIEDDPSVRELIKDLLEANNYKVLSASDGTNGILIGEKEKPNLIICDIMMPKLSGFEVIESLKKNPELNSIPFIFLTAKTEMSDIREGMELGADDYITKPFRAVNLLKAIETRLKRFETIQKKMETAKSQSKKNIYNEDDRLFITAANKPQFVKISDILCIKANSEYSDLFLLSGSKLLVRKLLKQWEEILPANVFLRIHRSSIININHIETMEKLSNRSYTVTLKNFEEKFIISQRYSSKLKTRFA